MALKRCCKNIKQTTIYKPIKIKCLMDIIKDKQQAINGLKEVLNNTESAKEIAKDIDELIFDFIYFHTSGNEILTAKETSVIFTARLVRDFFNSIEEINESNKV